MSSDEEIGELKVVYDFIAQAKFKKAFVSATKVLDQRSPLPPDAAEEDPLRELFLFVVTKYADQLEQEGKIEQVFEIIEQGLEYFPEHPELLNETGVRLQRARIRTKSKIIEIAQQLYAIDKGFKRGFLWDVGNLSANDVRCLLDSLKEVKQVANSLVVLQLGSDPTGDFGVCDINRFAGEQFRPMLVDVSRGLRLPRLADQFVVNLYHKLAESFRTGLNIPGGQLALESSAHECTPIMQWPLAAEVCRPTVYGIFIGYPVVYWYDTKYSQENCLSHVPLAVFQAAIKPRKDKRYGRSLEASICFERVLLQDSRYLKAYQNLQNTKCELVERWHFRMLNDIVRNAAFRAAIENQIAAGYNEVLDIGTGTGLLSMYALRCEGIRKAAACDGSEIMVQIARDVFGANGLSDRICLFQSYSQDLKIGERFSLIVTETLDSGAFGEGILETLIHAKKHLLLPEGKIIPAKVTLHVSGYQSRALTASNILINEAFSEDFSLPSNCLLSKEGTKCYDAEDIGRIQANDDFEFVTDTVVAIDVDFNDLDSLVRYQDGTEVGEVELTCLDDGLLLDGFVVWFDLQLDENSTISTDPTTNTCWNQAIFRLNQRLPVAKDQRLKLTMSCKDGALSIAHNLNSVDNQISVDEHVLEFLNDIEYYSSLTEATDALDDMEKILDLSLFPYAGLKLLKEGKARMLFCLDQTEDLIEFIANQNDISMGSIMLVSSVQEIFLLNDYTLDLIILQPVDVFGQINSEHFCLYQSLLAKLKPIGTVVPAVLELHGSVIESDWIVKCSRVENPELEQFQIDKYLASLETENHLDLGPFSYSNLSEPTKLADVQFDGKLHETELELTLAESTETSRLHAVLYHYRIGFTPERPLLATDRPQSFAKRSAFIIPKSTFQGVNSEEPHDPTDPIEQLCISVLQNHGVIKCDISLVGQ